MHLAPMVRCGTLPFRLLCLRHGASLLWTEELIAYKVAKCTRVVDDATGLVTFTTTPQSTTGLPTLVVSPEERGRTIVQLGAADPASAVAAAQVVVHDCAGIDVNMGCPKAFSLQGRMGAALLSDPDRAEAIMRALVAAVGDKVGVTCKIRLLPTMAETVAFVKRMVATGIHAISVHCRTKAETPKDFAHHDALAAILEAVGGAVPVIANGDVFTGEDLVHVMSVTAAAAAPPPAGVAGAVGGSGVAASDSGAAGGAAAGATAVPVHADIAARGTDAAAAAAPAAAPAAVSSVAAAAAAVLRAQRPAPADACGGWRGDRISAVMLARGALANPSMFRLASGLEPLPSYDCIAEYLDIACSLPQPNFANAKFTIQSMLKEAGWRSDPEMFAATNAAEMRTWLQGFLERCRAGTQPRSNRLKSARAAGVDAPYVDKPVVVPAAPAKAGGAVARNPPPPPAAGAATSRGEGGDATAAAGCADAASSAAPVPSTHASSSDVSACGGSSEAVSGRKRHAAAAATAAAEDAAAAGDASYRHADPPAPKRARVNGDALP